MTVPNFGVLIFDGECGFCRRWVQRMQRWFPKHPQPVAWQETDLEALGLTPAMCREAVQLVGVNGVIYSGARAVAQVLVIAGMPYSIAGRLMNLPGIRSVAEMAYRWVAANRHRFPGPASPQQE